MFVIRRRSTGETFQGRGYGSRFHNRQEAKPERDRMNSVYYTIKGMPVPEHNREYYVARSNLHRRGTSAVHRASSQKISPTNRRKSK